jgi:hypothetical protein
VNIEAAGFIQMQVTNFQTTLHHNLQDHDVSTDVKDSYLFKCTHCWCIIFPDSLPTVVYQMYLWELAQIIVTVCQNNLSLRKTGRFILLPKVELNLGTWLCV